MKKRNLISLSLLASFLAIPCLNKTNMKENKAADIGSDALWMDVPPTIKPVGEDEFTLALFGDTQKTTQNAPAVLERSFDWLVENKSNLKLKYVCGLGDIVDDVDNEDTGRDNIGDDPETQLRNASSFYRKLKNNDINFSLILGNHDYEDMAFFNRKMNAFNEYFPLETTYTPAANGEGYQGAMNDTIENTYHYFNHGNDKYMILCLGHNPNDQIVDWANQVLKANKDRKTIVVTHGYIDGGSFGSQSNYPYYSFYAGGYGERAPQGEKVFKKIIYENENVFMLLCGHSLGLDNKRIVRNDTYNKFGNVVHEFMINPADIDLPCGGDGLIALMTFRKDGTVDTNYYSPYLDKYFNPESQFTFDVENQFVEPSKEQTIVEKVYSSDMYENYSLYNLGSDAFGQKAHSYSNLVIANEGLVPTNDNGSITYKFAANNGSIIKDALVEFNYSSTSRKGGIAISTSRDGINYQIVDSFDGVSQSARKEASSYKVKDLLREYIYDSKEFYVRISFLNQSVNNISLSDFQVKIQTVKTVFNNGGTFGTSLNFSNYVNYDVNDWASDAIYIDDMLVMGGLLGTGRADDYCGARGVAIWRYDAPEGSTIESLTFNAKGRLTLSNNNIFTPPYCLKLSYSVNGGEYVTYVIEQKSGKTSFNYDLSSFVKGSSSVHIKLEMWGDSWNSVGLNSLSISGGYRYSINYHCGEGTNSTNNPSTYGTSDSYVSLEDPTCPQYYEFGGWYDNPEFKGEPMYDIPAGTYGNLDLYAKYVPMVRNITYHLNGGKNSTNNPKTFEIASGLKLENATRNGYSFRGWFDNEDFDGDAISEIAIGTEYDVELYAKFLKNYRISYVTNGGTITPEDKFDYFTEEDNFVLPIPTKQNYVFRGWYLEKTFENKIESIQLGTNAALIVYAKWEKVSSSKGCSGSVIATSAITSIISLLGISLILVRKKDNKLD